MPANIYEFSESDDEDWMNEEDAISKGSALSDSIDGETDNSSLEDDGEDGLSDVGEGNLDKSEYSDDSNEIGRKRKNKDLMKGMYSKTFTAIDGEDIKFEYRI